MGIFQSLLKVVWFIADLALVVFVSLATIGFVAMMLLKIYHLFFDRDN